MKAINIVDRINDGNRREERELTFLLAPIDRRLTVNIFTKSFFDYEVAVGRNGQNSYQPGARFRFGIHSITLCPYVINEKFCIDFEENFEIAMEWLHQTVANVIWPYFYKHPERVLAMVNPLSKAV